MNAIPANGLDVYEIEINAQHTPDQHICRARTMTTDTDNIPRRMPQTTNPMGINW